MVYISADTSGADTVIRAIRLSATARLLRNATSPMLFLCIHFYFHKPCFAFARFMSNASISKFSGMDRPKKPGDTDLRLSVSNQNAMMVGKR